MVDPRRSQQGVALAMLLWMLAGLSLLVAGIVTFSRSDVQLTRLQLEEARARAAATGAGHLLMKDLTVARQKGNYAGRGLFVRQYQLGDARLRARAIPLAGLISINRAPEPLLRDLFRYTGELSRADAEKLAKQVTDWRSSVNGAVGVSGGGSGVGGSFASFSRGGSVPVFGVKEDLLRVPGMRRVVYDRVAPAIHSRGAGSGSTGVDPQSAPASVLLTLSKGDRAQVDLIGKARQDADPGAAVPMRGLDNSYLSAGNSDGSEYCLEIEVKGIGERIMQQRIWVQMSPGGNGTPWQFARVEPLQARPQ